MVSVARVSEGNVPWSSCTYSASWQVTQSLQLSGAERRQSKNTGLEYELHVIVIVRGN